MSEQQRRRLRTAPAPRRVGEPNVLSNQAMPNRLSTMGTAGRQASPASASSAPTARPAVARPAMVRPTPIANRAAQVDSDDAAPRRRRLPSLGTLITIGFLIFWAARVFGNAGTPLPGPTARPAPVTPRPGATAPLGAVTFGRSLGTACALDQPGRAFAPDVVVWWRADLTQVMAADAAVVVVTFKGSNQIDYQYVPPDPSAGRWQVFCSGPVEGSDAGGYTVELWNAERSRLLARGEFTRIGPRATATPAAAGTFHGAGSPGATQAAALAGSVSFGTFFRNP